MKKESLIPQDKESLSHPQPVAPRPQPLARNEKGSATREEIRKQAPVLSAPRESRRPVERSGQKRAHSR